MITEPMRALVEHQRLGFVATVCPDGTPNVSPKGTVCVLDDDHLVFADLASPGTVENLRHNPSVEVNVVDHFVRKGYRFKGTAEVLTDGEDFDRCVEAIVARRLKDRPRTIRAVVKIRVERARPLVSPGYDDGTTEKAMRAEWVAHYTGHSPSRSR